MKNKILVVALIAVALTAGLVLVGCDHIANCPDKGKCYYNFTRPITERYVDCDDYCINNQLQKDPDAGTVHCDC